MRLFGDFDSCENSIESKIIEDLIMIFIVLLFMKNAKLPLYLFFRVDCDSVSSILSFVLSLSAISVLSLSFLGKDRVFSSVF